MPQDPNAKSAAQGGLTYVCDTAPGLRRKRAGKTFAYTNPRGQTIRDKRTLDRIRQLAIPPAWTDVWICTRPNGHIQATGRDARGRKQYRYHPRWAEVRGTEKFDRIIEFGKALPKLRRALRRDLALDGLPKERVAAIVVALLGGTLVRVGNDEYAETNNSFGLTTLRNRHIEFLKGGRARIAFRGKAGKDHTIVLDDARLTRLVRHIQQLPGQHLFQYRGDDGKPQPIGSGTVNDYLREAMGADFTAKDFRTWGGTMSALRLLADQPVPLKDDGSLNQRVANALRNTVVERVAKRLGNTAAVCRKSYIDPGVFLAWEDGRLHRACANARGPRQWEQAGLRVLRSAHRDAARANGT